MTVLSTAVRATHLVTNSAWFGGSLMGAVGLNPASRQPGTNRDRVLAHPPTTAAAVVKTALTAAAVASTAAAWVYGTRLGDASGEDGHPRDPEAAEDARRTMAWLQWATPALTGSLLVLDAQLGEQQRGAAGLLDRRW